VVGQAQIEEKPPDSDENGDFWWAEEVRGDQIEEKPRDFPKNRFFW